MYVFYDKEVLDLSIGGGLKYINDPRCAQFPMGLLALGFTNLLV